MSKYIILGLIGALVTVLLLLALGMIGLQAASTVLERKVRAIHIQNDIKTLQDDLQKVDSSLQSCRSVITGIQQLAVFADKREFDQKELTQTSIKIAQVAKIAAKCHKDKTWDNIIDNRGLSTKTQLAAFGNSVFVAGRQAGYNFNEEEMVLLQSIQDMQQDEIGREVVFDQADFIMPKLDTMLIQINKTLINAQRQL